MRTRNFVAGTAVAVALLSAPTGAAMAWKDPGLPGPMHHVPAHASIPPPNPLHGFHFKPFGAFGPRWHRVPQELADALAEGQWGKGAPRDWSNCAYRVGDTTVIVCPNGFTTKS